MNIDSAAKQQVLLAVVKAVSSRRKGRGGPAAGKEGQNENT